MIREHRSTLVFANSRRLIERMAGVFQDELAHEVEYHDKHPEQALPKVPTILPHHGSISKEVRLETEQRWFAARGGGCGAAGDEFAGTGYRCGGAGSGDPGRFAGECGGRALQRVGRAGHLEKATAKGRLLASRVGRVAEFGGDCAIDVRGGGGGDAGAGELSGCFGAADGGGVRRAAVEARGVVSGDAAGDAVPEICRRSSLILVVAMLSKRAERWTTQGLRPRLSFDRVK